MFQLAIVQSSISPPESRRLLWWGDHSKALTTLLWKALFCHTELSEELLLFLFPQLFKSHKLSLQSVPPDASYVLSYFQTNFATSP